MKDWQTWLRFFYDQTAWQNKKLLELESQLLAMKAQLDRIEAACGQPRIGHIDYHFDQLKVEKLEGELHIGISPGSTGLLDELSVNGKEGFDVHVYPQEPPQGPADGMDYRTSTGAQPADDPSLDPFAMVYRYIDDELPGKIAELEGSRGLLLGDQYRGWMASDLRKQVDARIRHYMQSEAARSPEAGPAQVVPVVTDKVKRDLEDAVLRHLAELAPRETHKETPE
ncbi:spore germination protein GerPC [Gorillibacterium massiliense]|uniref:spore germination protein GerPC n=1 Tax=Gorillibacterium massiliense TaxID=1280390 RepID=UPI0004B016B3|nr:spore germination protein GerPC [Gorillibacterium massiliense]